MIKDEFHLCQSPARERRKAVSSQLIIQQSAASCRPPSPPDWICEGWEGRGGLSACLQWSMGRGMVDWAGSGRDERVGPAKGDGEKILWGLRGTVCMYVCVRVCALTPMHVCQELCSLSDRAVSSAWLFPCT